MTRATAPTGLTNFRDLGGLPTEDGRRTRHGVLYRSDAPHPGDDPPGAVVWPPALVIDLRSPGEDPRPHPLASATTTVVVVPLQADAAPVRMADAAVGAPTIPTLASLYPQIVAAAVRELTPTLELAVRATGPVLVHCAAGKDRSGVLVALMLRAAGVTRDAIVADYMRTAENLPGVYDRMGISAANVDTVDRARSDVLRAPAYAIESALDLAGPGPVAIPDAAWSRRLVAS